MSDATEKHPGYLPPTNSLPKTRRPAFEVFDVSYRHAQICTKLSEKEAFKRLNDMYPGEWELASDYYETDPNPYPCDDHPKTHMHLLYIQE